MNTLIYCKLMPLEEIISEKKWERCCCSLCELARRINEEKWIMSTETLAIINELWVRVESAETDLAVLEQRLKNAPPGAVYDRELPDYGDLMPVQEFIDACISNSFIDYDGNGHPVRDGKMANVDIYPSKVKEIPYDATHIMWFNK